MFFVENKMTKNWKGGNWVDWSASHSGAVVCVEEQTLGA